MFSEGWRAEKNEEEKRSDGRFQHPRIASEDSTCTKPRHHPPRE